MPTPFPRLLALTLAAALTLPLASCTTGLTPDQVNSATPQQLLDAWCAANRTDGSRAGVQAGWPDEKTYQITLRQAIMDAQDTPVPVRQHILKGTIAPGMTTTQTILAWGPPTYIDRQERPDGRWDIYTWGPRDRPIRDAFFLNNQLVYFNAYSNFNGVRLQ